MNGIQAAEVVALLQAGFPNTDFTGPTGALYAEEFLAYEYEDALEGVRMFLRSKDWPSVAGVITEIMDARDERYRREANEARVQGRELADGFRAAAPEWVKDKLDSYFTNFGQAHHVTLGRTETKVEHARRRVAAKLAEPKNVQAEGQVKPLQRTGRPQDRSSCGTPWGTPLVQRGSQWVCPGCGSPVEEGCG